MGKDEPTMDDEYLRRLELEFEAYKTGSRRPESPPETRVTSHPSPTTDQQASPPHRGSPTSTTWGTLAIVGTSVLFVILVVVAGEFKPPLPDSAPSPQVVPQPQSLVQPIIPEAIDLPATSPDAEYLFVSEGQPEVLVRIANDDGKWTQWVLRPDSGTDVMFTGLRRAVRAQFRYSNGSVFEFEDAPGLIADLRDHERALPKGVIRTGVRFLGTPKTKGMEIVVFFAPKRTRPAGVMTERYTVGAAWVTIPVPAGQLLTLA